MDTPADAYDVTHPDYVDTPGHDVVDAPGIHHTHDYFRTGPDGSLQHVNGYDATNPDGIVENNFSYNHGDGSAHGSPIDTPADGVPADAPADGISAETVDHAMDSVDAAPDRIPTHLGKEDKKSEAKTVTAEIVDEPPRKRSQSQSPHRDSEYITIDSSANTQDTIDHTESPDALPAPSEETEDTENESQSIKDNRTNYHGLP